MIEKPQRYACDLVLVHVPAGSETETKQAREREREKPPQTTETAISPYRHAALYRARDDKLNGMHGAYGCHRG